MIVTSQAGYPYKLYTNGALLLMLCKKKADLTIVKYRNTSIRRTSCQCQQKQNTLFTIVSSHGDP
jgi:hypothetical protein